MRKFLLILTIGFFCFNCFAKSKCDLSKIKLGENLGEPLIIGGEKIFATEEDGPKLVECEPLDKKYICLDWTGCVYVKKNGKCPNHSEIKKGRKRKRTQRSLGKADKYRFHGRLKFQKSNLRLVQIGKQPGDNKPIGFSMAFPRKETGNYKELENTKLEKIIIDMVNGYVPADFETKDYKNLDHSRKALKGILKGKPISFHLNPRKIIATVSDVAKSMQPNDSLEGTKTPKFGGTALLIDLLSTNLRAKAKCDLRPGGETVGSYPDKYIPAYDQENNNRQFIIEI